MPEIDPGQDVESIDAAVRELQKQPETQVRDSQIALLTLTRDEWGLDTWILEKHNLAALDLAKAIVAQSNPLCEICSLRIRRSLRDGDNWVHADTGIAIGYVFLPHFASRAP